MAGVSERPKTFFRLSPAEDGKARCFAVRRGDVAQRLNAVYFASGHQTLLKTLEANPRVIALGNLIGESGFGVLPPGNSYVSEGGVRFLRATELGPDNTIAWEACLRAPAEYAKHDRATLKIGDVLVAVKGATIASEKSVCTVSELSEPTIINGSIFRFQPKPKTTAEFLLAVLSSKFMRRQMKGALIQNNAVDYLSKDVLASLLFPLPDKDEQTRLVSSIDKARAERRAKLAEADALLAGLDDLLLATLGLTPPSKDDRKVFAALRSDVEGKQIGANLYAPALRKFLQSLSSSHFPTRKLCDEVVLNPSVTLEGLGADTPVSFIPMDAVAEGAAGDVRLQTRPLSEVRKGYTPFASGDVLWAKITPCMENGKSCVAPGLTNGVGFGSTEFHVLRPRSKRVTAEYVHEFISQASLRRVARFAFTGSAGQQRVPEDFLAELPFPVPPVDVQKTIAAESRRRREESRRCREEANTGWQAAKQLFEEQLLGGAK